MRLLLLEDERDQAETLSGWLQEAGHLVRHCSGLAECRNLLRRDSFDLLIFDWMLPDGTGLELLRWLRDQAGGRFDPVIFVTARNAEEDIVAALDTGADDYLAKPVRRLELLSRIEALRRRIHPPTPASALDSPPYRFDLERRCCFLDGREIELTDKEFAVALLLFRNAGNLLARQHILETIWGIDGDVSTRTVDTHVSRIRQKLAIRPDQGYRLAAIYNFGYRLEVLGSAA